MIQRIQSVYLLVVVALLVVAMWLPMGYFTDALGEHVFKTCGVEAAGSAHSTWGLLCILILSAIVALGTIFLFKNRVLQIRMTIFNSLLLVGYYLAFLAFYFALKQDDNLFCIGWGLSLPFIAIVFNLLAIRAIKKDEVLVKAADRLR